MSIGKKIVIGPVVGLLLGSFLALCTFAGPPGGKGGDKGTGGPSLPADLDVRYRVQFIPLPATGTSNFAVHDINDVYEAVGAFSNTDGRRIGYYYDAVNDVLRTAADMITLPARWENTSFTGINNAGAIVGMVQDQFGFHQCLLIYPGPDGYSYEIMSPIDAFGAMDSHFTQINDSGDVVGISWDAEGVGQAFAYNLGIFPLEAPEDPRDFTFIGVPGAWWDSIQVKNARLGIVRVGDVLSQFDFVSGQESLVQLPANERSPTYEGISHDGQLTVSEALVERKGKNVSYRYTPGIMVDGQYVWQGNLDDGYATLVNTAVEGNIVGDVVGFNEISRVRWLRHADHPEWAYLDLGAMVVFSSAADEQLWSSIPGSGVRVWKMSDRDPVTGFGVLAGHYSAWDTHLAYVLLPEVVPQP